MNTSSIDSRIVSEVWPVVQNLLNHLRNNADLLENKELRSMYLALEGVEWLFFERCMHNLKKSKNYRSGTYIQG